MNSEDNVAFQYYRDAFYADFFGKAVIDSSGRWLLANRSFLRMAGFEAHQLEKHTAFDLFPGVGEVIRSLHLDGRTNATLDCPYTPPAGDQRYIRIRIDESGASADAAGAPRRFLLHLSDITDSRKAEQESAHLRAHLDLILDTIVEGVYGFDTNARARYWNAAAEKMTGYSADDLSHIPLLKLISPPAPEDGMPARERNDAYAVSAHAQAADVQHGIFRRKDGTSFPAEYKVHPVMDGGKSIGTLIAFTDKTERIKSDELILQSEKLAAAGQLAAGIAHEIRNPLTSLKGFLQLFNSGGASQSKREAYVSIMNDELNRIEQILSELLVLSKPQTVQFVRKRLSALVDQVVSLMQPLAILKNVEINVQPMSEMIFVYCDDNQIKQILLNLMKNGIESMPQGGWLTIAMEADSDQVAIIITDTGVGIPEHKLPRLGEPFFTTKENGTGLGLMVSYKLIENHNGRIHVQSRLHEGTTFTVTLPRDMK
ncbi:histidine kinase [Paenibacillus darwinianus]|uniref:histidine kinase n=1 Tax=Paenibacillus darwinianus TaxID=1380763 RepID=A0A9W5S0D1_9BACL|nr:ATP-binding protein [Paenibacillus darwinianus]EXX87821.1 histidine kinase [Paenibacillus darwinianus]EXX88211.1 histidine kinase [Paenibacillus darwinianus]EXX89067.1 histidine kinase [Paenibacillus darwinianus]